MDTQDIRTLKLMEEIDKDYTQSQRDLSNKLDISLGLVNSFVKRLASKGYFKIPRFLKVGSNIFLHQKVLWKKRV